MKRTVFLVLALFALMAVGLYAQTEADFDVEKSKDGKSIVIIEYKGKAKDVKIPEKIQNLPVTIIDSAAFAQDKNITSIIIPGSVTSIGDHAFANSTNITSVTFEGSIQSSNLHSTAFFGIGNLRDRYLTTTGGIPGTYTRPAGSTTWTKQAASTAAPAAAETAGLAFTAIKRNSVSPIEEYSVAKGTVTTGAVVIPASYNNLPVTAIGSDAFRGTQITAVTIPDSVKTIGGNAFRDCASLTSVTIGKSVTEIGALAFRGCAKLTSVTFSGQIPFDRFYDSAFLLQGDLYDKYFAAGGGAGTYTRPSGGETWTKK